MQANAATALIYYSLLLNNINQYRLQYIAFFSPDIMLQKWPPIFTPHAPQIIKWQNVAPMFFD